MWPTEVNLRSSDGVDRVVAKSVAALSTHLSARIQKMQMGHGKSKGEQVPVMEVHDVKGNTLDMVVKYLNVLAGSANKEEAMKEFEAGHLAADTDMGVLLDLVLGANSLGVEGLMDVVSGNIAARIKDKSVEWVRNVFDLPNDIPAEEVAAYMAEFGWAFEGVDQD